MVGIDVRGRLEEGDESAEARRKRERKADNGGLGVREGEVKVVSLSLYR